MTEPSASASRPRPEHELRAHALDVDAVDDLLDVWENLTGKLQLAQSQRPPFAGRAEQQEEAEKLQSASRPRQPGITGSPLVAGKN